MVSLSSTSSEDIKYNKIWNSKDKFFARYEVGPHWYLKKTLVIWKYFLIERRKITKETLTKIGEEFQTFVDSISDKKIKKAAEDYFFKPKDFRKPKTIISFEKFNDDNNQEMNARKLFIVYLMGIGGQPPLKGSILHLLQKSNHLHKLGNGYDDYKVKSTKSPKGGITVSKLLKKISK